MARSSRTSGWAWVALFAVVLVAAGCAGGPAGDACSPCAPTARASGAPGDLPPGAQPGEAWCRVWVPAEYATVCETVCVKPLTKRCVTIPAKYDVRPKLVCVEPARMCQKIQPAVFATKKRQVMVCPEREEVKQICCTQDPTLKGNEIQTACFTKVVHPARYEEEECPVCISPERRCVEYVPPRYQVVEERFEVEPARVQELCEPPKFEKRIRQVMVRPARWEWKKNDNCTPPPACPPSPCGVPSGVSAPIQTVPMPMPVPIAPIAPIVVPEAEPSALSVSVQDMATSGEDAGAFSVGDTVRYDILIESPAGSNEIQIVFDLPAELEFIEGNGGVAFEGSGQSVKTAVFTVPAGGTMTLSLYAKAIGAPESTQVEVSARVLDGEGNEIVKVKERTQLMP